MTPKRVRSPLERVRNPQARVDLLVARVVAEGVRVSNSERVKKFHAHAQPVVDSLLYSALGPHTRRGRKLAQDLFLIRSAVENLRGAA